MTIEMRALGLLLVVSGVAVACGSTTREPVANTGGCAGIAAISGGTTPVAGTEAAGGSIATSGTGGTASPSPSGGDAGSPASDGAEAGAGGEAGSAQDTGKTAISGVVVGVDELPVAGAIVQAQGHRVTTGADGRFQLHVDPPYDLVLFEPKLSQAEEPDVAEPRVYLGLTRTQLKLAVRAQLNHTTTISGTLTGPLVTPDAMLGLVYGHSAQSIYESKVEANGHYSVNAPAWHADPLSALLIVTQPDPPQNETDPLHINSLAFKQVDLTAGKPAQVDLTLTKPTFHKLAFSWAQPSGQIFEDCDITVQVAWSIALFDQYGCNPVNRDLDIPDGLPDGVIRVVAHGYSSVNTWEYDATATIPGAATSFSVPVPQGLPTVESPEPNAMLTTSTGAIRYSLAEGKNALAVLKLCFPDWKAKRLACANVYTSETTVPLQRLLGLDMHMAASGTLSLEVGAIPSITTTDDLVAPTHFEADGTWLYRNYDGVSVRNFLYTAD